MKSNLPSSSIKEGSRTSARKNPRRSPTPLCSAFSPATESVFSKRSTATALQSFLAASVDIAIDPGASLELTLDYTVDIAYGLIESSNANIKLSNFSTVSSGFDEFC